MEVHGFVSQFKALCVELDKGTETDFDSDLEKLTAFSPNAPVGCRMKSIDVFHCCGEAAPRMDNVSNEKNYLDWDREIRSPFISFDNLRRSSRVSPILEAYAEGLRGDAGRAIVSQAWIDNLLHQPEWTANGFEDGLTSL